MVLLDDILWVNEGPIDALHYYTDYFGVMPSIFSPVSGGMAVWTNDDLKNVKINGMSNVFEKIVLEDVNIRHELSKFSNWPTIPQLFHNGELIGGCDIAVELHNSGELAKILDK